MSVLCSVHELALLTFIIQSSRKNILKFKIYVTSANFKRSKHIYQNDSFRQWYRILCLTEPLKRHCHLHPAKVQNSFITVLIEQYRNILLHKMFWRNPQFQHFLLFFIHFTVNYRKWQYVTVMKFPEVTP